MSGLGNYSFSFGLLGAGLPQAGYTQRNQANLTADCPRQSLTSEIRLTPLPQEVPSARTETAWELNPHTTGVAWCATATASAAQPCTHSTMHGTMQGLYGKPISLSCRCRHNPLPWSSNACMGRLHCGDCRGSERGLRVLGATQDTGTGAKHAVQRGFFNLPFSLARCTAWMNPLCILAYAMSRVIAIVQRACTHVD